MKKFSNFRFFGFDDLRNVALRVIFAGQPKHIEVAPEMLRFGFSINLDQKAENLQILGQVEIMIKTTFDDSRIYLREINLKAFGKD